MRISFSISAILTSVMLFFIFTERCYSQSLIGSGSFVFDDHYPMSPYSNKYINIFGIRGSNAIGKEVVYKIYLPSTNLFSYSRSIRADGVFVLIGPCKEYLIPKGEFVKRIGGFIQEISNFEGLARYNINSDYPSGSIYIPLFRNLSIYVPPNGDLGFEWVERAERAHQICAEFGAGRLYGPSILYEVNISDDLYFYE